MAINGIITVITQLGWIHPRRLYKNRTDFTAIYFSFPTTNVLVIFLGNKIKFMISAAIEN